VYFLSFFRSRHATVHQRNLHYNVVHVDLVWPVTEFAAFFILALISLCMEILMFVVPPSLHVLPIICSFPQLNWMIVAFSLWRHRGSGRSGGFSFPSLIVGLLSITFPLFLLLALSTSFLFLFPFRRFLKISDSYCYSTTEHAILSLNYRSHRTSFHSKLFRFASDNRNRRMCLRLLSTLSHFCISLQLSLPFLFLSTSRVNSPCLVLFPSILAIFPSPTLLHFFTPFTKLFTRT
jgi:hypothetical protein